MDKKTMMLLAGGIAITIALVFIDIYLAGIAFIILIALVMSQMIMADTILQPEIAVRLKEDAKAIVLTNTGNSVAMNIHVALVPLDVEYDVKSLPVETSHEYQLPKMAEEVKVVVTYENEKQNSFTGTFRVSSLGPEYDPLKPMIPVFGWKKN